jgi:peptide-methionine (R)-S-oxide reductase
MMTRRHFIPRRLFLQTALAGLATSFALSSRTLAASAEKFEVTHSDEEWRKLLSPAQYEILRKDGTERAYTSPLLKEHRRGAFACAGCDLPLFDSATKYDSGTGWPSFWKPLDKAVVEETDNSYGMVRMAVHCRRCGGHLGHVFNDGPEPTGLRYCMNGVAMTFKSAEA